ncbi:MAG: transposase, partial [Ruminococcus sp.]
PKMQRRNGIRKCIRPKRKCAVRCKVEHAFKIIKDTFGFRKVRYRGLAKNFNKLNVLFACANLLMVKRGQIKSQKALIRG